VNAAIRPSRPRFCRDQFTPFSASLSISCFSFHFVSFLWGLFSEIGSRAMSKTLEQEMSVLSSSKHGLVYLTSNDWALVADKASRVHFKKGQALVHQGIKTDGIYLVLKGTARVRILAQNKAATIGPGEICGEMSLLEDAPASAGVVAEEEVEAYHLDRATLESLFELFPHLASRFYRSLAKNLSRRLRDLIGQTSASPAGSGKAAL
jgi:CRP-like cAMP-binding protein